MVRNRAIKLTRFELELMDVLWDLGQASIREIQERLPEQRQPAYTTVQTIIRRLEQKGAVRQVKKIGNAHIFEPQVTRRSAHRRVIDDLLQVFGGSAGPLMAHLVEEGKLTLEDLKELEISLAKLETKKETEKSGADKSQRVATREERRRKVDRS